jgi:hypothetical protein
MPGRLKVSPVVCLGVLEQAHLLILFKEKHYKHPPFLLPLPEPEGFPQARREFLRGLFPQIAQLQEI